MSTTTALSIAPALEPSGWLLSKQIDAAMAKFDADRDQAALADDAKGAQRMERFLVATALSNRRLRLYGVK